MYITTIQLDKISFKLVLQHIECYFRRYPNHIGDPVFCWQVNIAKALNVLGQRMNLVPNLCPYTNLGLPLYHTHLYFDHILNTRENTSHRWNRVHRQRIINTATEKRI
jgi:hypothetical protein